LPSSCTHGTQLLSDSCRNENSLGETIEAKFLFFL